MPPSKEDTVDLFFPKPEEVTQTAGTPDPPKRWRIIKLVRMLLATFFHIIFVFLALEMIVLSPAFNHITSLTGLPGIATVTGFYEDTPGALTARLTTLEYQLDILRTLSTRFTQVESRLESLEALSSLILDVKLRLDALDASPPPRNFARRADGARTIKGLTSSSHQWGRVLGYFRSKSSTKAVPPSLVLDETLGSYCWEFVGSQGQLGIRLSEETRIASFSVNHAHRRSLSPVAAGKAPRTFALWGLYPHASQLPVDITVRPASEFIISNPLPGDISSGEVFVMLINGTYDLLSVGTRQYFDVPPSIQSLLPDPIGVVVLEISENWGSNTTCLYSIGIHAEKF